MDSPRKKNYVVVDKFGNVHYYYIEEMAKMLSNIDGSSGLKVLSEEAGKETLRDWLLGILQQQEVSLTFEKKDGTMRNMRCTLQAGVVPPYEGKGTKAVNENVIPVFDLDAQGWRSFRVDSVRKISFTL
jgi:hypothetical protein